MDCTTKVSKLLFSLGYTRNDLISHIFRKKNCCLQCRMSPFQTASDDEEDLEQLRLAALQTIKKPCASNTQNNLNKGAYYKKTGFNGLSNKRGRGFHGGQGGRPLRNVSVYVHTTLYHALNTLFTGSIYK